VAVTGGQRPDLDAITGPETSVKHIKACISRCWHQSPDRRPSFAGMYYYCISVLHAGNDLFLCAEWDVG